jgi:hypothetical protein
MLRHPKTTLVGIVTAGVGLAVTTGVLSAEIGGALSAFLVALLGLVSHDGSA